MKRCAALLLSVVSLVMCQNAGALEGLQPRPAVKEPLAIQGNKPLLMKHDLSAQKVDLFLPGGTPTTTPAVGQVVNFNCQFQYKGPGLAANSFSVRTEIDGQVIHESALDMPLGNNSNTGTSAGSWKVTPGSHTAKCIVDSKGQVAESNETNNTATLSFVGTAASGLPDLAIKGLYLDYQCNVNVEVTNLGPGEVPDSVWTDHKPESSSVYLSGAGLPGGGATIWYFDTSKALKYAGGVATYKSIVKVPASATVKATIDHTKQVAEADDTNNAKEEVLTCPDYAANAITIKTSPLTASKTVEFSADFSKPAGKPGPVLWVKWELDGTVLKEEQLAFVFNTSATAAATASWPSATAGSHTIKFTVNSKKTVAESNDTNNTASLTFTVAP